jgi:hypothetical protein
VVGEYISPDPQIGHLQETPPDCFQDPVIGRFENRKWGVIFAAVLDLLEYVGRGVFE